MVQTTKRIDDCRDCPNFFWDFDAGRFYCRMAEQRPVEDLHLVPDWCPLADALRTTEVEGRSDTAG